MPEFSRADVAQHNKPTDLWCIIDGKVYDLTDFAEMHPGSAVVLWKVAGTDATEQVKRYFISFYGLHRQEILKKYQRLVVGTVTGESSKLAFPTPGSFSSVPYAESLATLQKPSPFYTPSHLAFKKAVRAFCDEHITPDAESYGNMGKFPEKETLLKMGAANLHACRLGPGDYLKGLKLLGGVKPEEFDYFHEAIAHEEFTRAAGIYCYGEGLGSGMMIGAPPILKFGPKWMHEKIMPSLFSGEKMICLAISEPGAGSDVASIQCEAVKTPDGKFFIVNGTKKWITNGSFSDYFTTAVKTAKGISMLLIERSEGVSTEPIKTSGTTSAGTAYVTFENVKVPVENLIGKDGGGFAVIMANFNHERWAMVAGCCAAARQIIEECFKWASQRKVFGKPLIEQPVIRFKLGQMIAELESLQSWYEVITFQMTKMSYKEQTQHLAGPIGLLKYRCTRMTHLVSDNAVQIFGGRAITRTGMGRLVEQFQRVNKFGAILGGAEEILLDLGVRQAMKVRRVTTGAWKILQSSVNGCNGKDDFSVLRAASQLERFPPHLANKLVLLIGDSFERNLVTELCGEENTVAALLNGTLTHNPISIKTITVGDSRICTLRAKNNDVFVAINIFHFGIVSDFSRYPQDGFHWAKGYSPVLASERIQWIPHMLRSVAGHAFPELCHLAHQNCSEAVWRGPLEPSVELEDWTPPFLDPTQPFWFPQPDAIVAQSSTWDLAKFNQNLFDQFESFLGEWEDKFEKHVMEPAESLFTPHTPPPTTRLFVRTLPLPRFGSRFTNPKLSPIHAMNELVRRRFGGRKGWGLLDWDRLLSGTEYHEQDDDEHPNEFGNQVFWQLLLSRLWLMNPTEFDLL
ncbi:hypothetical protein HDU98_001851 [Podochytrium sp. JEL0797]|nr:hypothetical protein HDU98_001851 [Podochytrium sp. JEL0797]